MIKGGNNIEGEVDMHFRFVGDGRKRPRVLERRDNGKRRAEYKKTWPTEARYFIHFPFANVFVEIGT